MGGGSHPSPANQPSLLASLSSPRLKPSKSSPPGPRALPQSQPALAQPANQRGPVAISAAGARRRDGGGRGGGAVACASLPLSGGRPPRSGAEAAAGRGAAGGAGGRAGPGAMGERGTGEGRVSRVPGLVPAPLCDGVGGEAPPPAPPVWGPRPGRAGPGRRSPPAAREGARPRPRESRWPGIAAGACGPSSRPLRGAFPRGRPGRSVGRCAAGAAAAHPRRVGFCVSQQKKGFKKSL